ncbi:UDP-glucose 4-epimerase GalE [Gallaecimonas sp. GXIMD4217]|uniref:UDP-glucose 4-epimerase GalE n=1 Tax=Gallaecimonas sp. GXIMD4217 TaxID=3131927 RepID=UPI00311B218F
MILVTGGAGYIGSHTVLELLNAGHQVMVLDNLANSSTVALKRVSKLTGKDITFLQGDIRDRKLLDQIFSDNTIDAVVHFAGLKAVGESNQQPLRYYQNNVAGSLTLCEAMAAAGVFKLVFSSSATVYGDPVSVPITENSPTGATTNPYGTSKYMVERMLADLAHADERWRIAVLRYFNPTGAHKSGIIGEDPNGIPNNLLPFICQVAVGRREVLSVYGDDYPTIDGTGVRDYIHVVDLALGHLKALDKLADASGWQAYNLGTGKGYSVLQIVQAFEQVSGRTVPYQVVPRRPGDIATCYADPSLAAKTLGWQPERGLEAMMLDAWRWQSQNPNGYGGL